MSGASGSTGTIDFLPLVPATQPDIFGPSLLPH
jgi:hypothetical protein